MATVAELCADLRFPAVLADSERILGADHPGFRE